MSDSREGQHAEAVLWEQNAYRAIDLRNRVLGPLAILAIILSTAWIWIEGPAGLDHSAIDPSTFKRWSVDLNRATARELLLIPGLGPKLVDAILEHRQRIGGFRSLEQLTEIPGIKSQRARVLARYLRVTPSSETRETKLVDR